MIDLFYLGMRVRKCREDHGYTIEYLAGLLGISLVFMRSIEYGKRGMSVDTLAKLAAALEVSTDYILFGSPDNK